MHRLLAIALVLLAGQGILAQEVAHAQKLPWRILYAGDRDTVNTQAYMEFLREHSAHVQFVPRDELRTERVRGFDVVIIDGELYDKSDAGQPMERRRIAEIPESIVEDSPVILIGGVGGVIGAQWKLKVGWSYG